jgi:hypothetical protein
MKAERDEALKALRETLAGLPKQAMLDRDERLQKVASSLTPVRQAADRAEALNQLQALVALAAADKESSE